MPETKIRVLIVDDDQDQLSLVERTLSAFGFDVRTHRSSLGVSNLVRTTQPDLVLLDVNIPALSGDKVLTLARGQAPKGTKFILYSASDESQLRAWRAPRARTATSARACRARSWPSGWKRSTSSPRLRKPCRPRVSAAPASRGQVRHFQEDRAEVPRAPMSLRFCASPPVERKNIIASGGGLIFRKRGALREKWWRMSRLISQTA